MIRALIYIVNAHQNNRGKVMEFTLSTAMTCIETNLRNGKITRAEAKELIRLTMIKYC